jgi:magnesium transporter
MMAHDRTEGDAAASLAPAMLQEVWLTSTPQERLERFHRLPWAEAETFFLSLSAHDQAEVVRGLPLAEQRLWMRLLAPDDAADVIQEAPPEDHDGLLALLAEPIRGEVMGLLAYDEEECISVISPSRLTVYTSPPLPAANPAPVRSDQISAQTPPLF